MKRIARLALVLLLFFLLLFAFTLPLGAQLESWVAAWPRSARWSLALAGAGLLIADVLLPIPSSLIMIMQGALLGWLPGAALALASSTGAGLVGWALGTAGRGAVRRWVTDGDLAQGEAFFARWGHLAIIVSRPIPLLAETVSIVAGTCRVPPGRMLAYCLAGNLPACALYAWAGASAQPGDPLGLLPLAGALAFASVVFFVGKWWPARSSAS